MEKIYRDIPPEKIPWNIEPVEIKGKHSLALPSTIDDTGYFCYI